MRHTVSKLTRVPLNAKPFERLALKLPPALILEKFKRTNVVVIAQCLIRPLIKLGTLISKTRRVLAHGSET